MTLEDLRSRFSFASIITAIAGSLLTYTVVITLTYASVVKDIAIIRTTIDERTISQRDELVRMREELGRNREEIAGLRVTVEQLRSDLTAERIKNR